MARDADGSLNTLLLYCAPHNTICPYLRRPRLAPLQRTHRSPARLPLQVLEAHALYPLLVVRLIRAQLCESGAGDASSVESAARDAALSHARLHSGRPGQRRCS